MSQEDRFIKLRNERRFIIAAVRLDIIGEMLCNNELKYSFDGLPKDAIFVSADRDIQHQAFHFVYLHESFEPVPQGGLPIIVYLSIKATNKNHLLSQLAAAHDNGDTEVAHSIADKALLEYIDDSQITKAYNLVDKWYA